MNTFLKIIAIVLAGVSAVMSILLFLRLHWPAPVLWFLKLFVSALSPLFACMGILGIVVGLVTNSVLIGLAGTYVFLIFSVHIFRVTRPPDPSSSFEQAFGLDWQNLIRLEQRIHFLSRRTIIRLPTVAKPRLNQNLPFATIPSSERQLLCDLWQPPENIPPSGLAFIYLHSSAWYLLDKDLGTRPFFSQLANQGHVIMDVAYRLAPETDMMGMVHDVKRAIVWMKENAGSYGVNPNRIVVGGGSAGGHLALLAAYTADDTRFIPNDLEGNDISVCAVISLYGPTDLKAMYYHTNQHLTTRPVAGSHQKTVPTQMPQWIIKGMGKNYHRLGMDKDLEKVGAFAPLLGGHPDECPEAYVFFSPAMHVHSVCPTTLLIQGKHDLMAPVSTTQFLYTLLVKNRVPVILHFLPQTDHAFDLILPKISPSAHNALYDVERFLALMV